MHFTDDVTVHGIRTEFGDAGLTLYRISMNKRREQEDKSDSFAEHSHFYFECHVITAGITCFIINGEEIPVRRGELFLIPPQTAHCPFQRRAENAEIVFAVTLEPIEGEKGLYACFHSAMQKIACVPTPLPPALLTKFQLFYAQFSCTSFRDLCMQKTMAYEIITTLFDQINGFQVPSEMHELHPGEAKKLMILEYLVNDLLPISVIAENLGYTVRHTARLIRQVYGRSLGEIQDGIRLASAKWLLSQDSAMSMDNVAFQSGFASADCMRRAFRRWEHQTPTEYRKGTITHE